MKSSNSTKDIFDENGIQVKVLMKHFENPKERHLALGEVQTEGIYPQKGRKYLKLINLDSSKTSTLIPLKIFLKRQLSQKDQLSKRPMKD